MLGGLSDYEGGYRIPENLAGGVGTAILLLIIAGAVALFLSYGRRMEPYEAWEHEPVGLAYGVTGMVEKEKALYEGQHTRLLILGVGLCILAAVPLFVAAAVVEDGMLLIAAVDLLPAAGGGRGLSPGQDLHPLRGLPTPPGGGGTTAGAGSWRTSATRR